jgi:hypothetical protein
VTCTNPMLTLAPIPRSRLPPLASPRHFVPTPTCSQCIGYSLEALITFYHYLDLLNCTIEHFGPHDAIQKLVAAR